MWGGEATTMRKVLPEAESRAGRRILTTVDDLLSDESRRELHESLAEMHRQQIEAEASFTTLRIC